MNRSWKRLLFGAITLSLLSLSAVEGTPSASGQSEPSGAGIAVEEPSGSITPLTGLSGGRPTSTEATHAEAAASNGGSPVITEAGIPESVNPPDGRLRVNPTTSFPASAIGQIELSQDGSNFICTGWLIDRNSILTSGHCAYDPLGPPNDIIDSATWFPGRNRAADPFGSCVVSSLFAPDEWRLNRSAVHDWAVMNFANPGGCQAIGDTTGWFGLVAVTPTNALNNKFATVQGYPGDKPPGTQSKMRGRIHHATARTIFYPMDTAGGQSGSPIWQTRNTGPCIGFCGLGIHSYGFAPGAPPAQRLNSGPRINAFRLGQIADIADNNGV